MKTIKELLVLSLFCLSTVLANAQDHKIRVTTQGGWMHGGAITSNEREASGMRDVNGLNYSGDISYFFTKRFFAGVHYNYGDMSYMSYLMDPKSETSYRNTMGQGSMVVMNIGLITGYCLPLSPYVNMTGQIGFAHFVQMDHHPKVMYVPDETMSSGFDEKNGHGGSFNFFSASFPVKLSMGVMPFKKMNIGVMKSMEVAYACGWYIEPDFGFFTCVYHGPQLSVSF